MMPEFDGTALSIGAALLAGLLGSTHCLAMCGGFAGALGMRARSQGAGAAAMFGQTLATQLGRVTSYALAGTIAGTFGTALQASLHLTQVEPALRALAGLILIGVAIRVAFGFNLFAPVERLGARFWTLLAPIARRATVASSRGWAGAILLAALWGWLPCGLVYSMLLYAALAGGPLAGATTMFAFGLGTLPAMTGGSYLFGAFSRALRVPSARFAAAGVLASFGALTLLMLLPAFHHHH